MQDSGWTNIPFTEVLGATDLANVAINPENPSQVFIPSFHSGLLEINDNVATNLLADTNSPYERSNVTDGGLRINGGTYDSQNNL